VRRLQRFRQAQGRIGADVRPPRLDVVDLEVEPSAYRRRGIVAAERELSRAECEMHVRRITWWPVSLGRYTEQPFVPLNRCSEVADVNANVGQAGDSMSGDPTATVIGRRRGRGTCVLLWQ
jgi:hypothetical protein